MFWANDLEIERDAKPWANPGRGAPPAHRIEETKMSDSNLSPVLPLIGVGAGWLLNELSSLVRARREWRRRSRELLLENYAEWMAGMEEVVAQYARQTSGETKREYRTPLCEKRLLLLERSERNRRLVRQVWDSIPSLGTADYQEFTMSAQADPDWDWPPFRRAMDELADVVRREVA